jgi:hypothetical protein
MHKNHVTVNNRAKCHTAEVARILKERLIHVYTLEKHAQRKFLLDFSRDLRTCDITLNLKWRPRQILRYKRSVKSYMPTQNWVHTHTHTHTFSLHWCVLNCGYKSAVANFITRLKTVSKNKATNSLKPKTSILTSTHPWRMRSRWYTSDPRVVTIWHLNFGPTVTTRLASRRRRNRCQVSVASRRQLASCRCVKPIACPLGTSLELQTDENHWASHCQRR